MEPLDVANFNSRVELAHREAVYEDSYDLTHPGPDGPSIPDELLALLYIFLLDEGNLAAVETGETALPTRSKLSTSLVGQFLIEILRRREKEYGTTIEEDEGSIREANLPHRKAQAIQVRVGEKQVLRKAIEEAATFKASNKRMRGNDGHDEVVAIGTKRKGHRSEGDEKRARKK